MLSTNIIDHRDSFIAKMLGDVPSNRINCLGLSKWSGQEFLWQVKAQSKGIILGIFGPGKASFHCLFPEF